MLKVGDIVEFRGRLWEVDLVSASRARIVPLDRREVVIPGIEGEEERKFLAKDKPLSIGNESDLPVVGRVEEGKVGSITRKRGTRRKKRGN